MYYIIWKEHRVEVMMVKPHIHTYMQCPANYPLKISVGGNGFKTQHQSVHNATKAMCNGEC